MAEAWPEGVQPLVEALLAYNDKLTDLTQAQVLRTIDDGEITCLKVSDHMRFYTCNEELVDTLK